MIDSEVSFHLGVGAEASEKGWYVFPKIVDNLQVVFQGDTEGNIVQVDWDLEFVVSQCVVHLVYGFLKELETNLAVGHRAADHIGVWASHNSREDHSVLLLCLGGCGLGGGKSESSIFTAGA